MKNQILMYLSMTLLFIGISSCNKCKDCALRGTGLSEKKCGEELRKAEVDSSYSCD